MRPPYDTPVVRLSVRPDEQPAFTAPRPRGSRRPHTDARVAAVRRLVEETALTYAEIEARTGVGRASICRWTRDGGWQRPLFAPRATDTIPRPRASAKLKRRLLAQRLAALAERYVREMEETPGVDLDKLAEALELLKMAKYAARPKKRRKPFDAILESAAPPPAGEHHMRAAMRELRSAGVDVMRAPEEALEDFIATRAPLPQKHKPARSYRARLAERHQWLLGRDET